MLRFCYEDFMESINSCNNLSYIGTLQLISFRTSTTVFEIDTVCELRRAIDGDTIDAFPCGRIRFADIDAPKLGTLEGEKRGALENLLNRYGPKLYLDVDDIYVIDRYNRIVAVVYVRYNSTHLLNINKWLIDNKYATVWDFQDNEFNPYT